MSRIIDNRPCLLGEGPLRPRERGQLFWFDILGRRMLTGDRNRLLFASETRLSVMYLKTLCVTSTRADPTDAVLAAEPANGRAFAADAGLSGLTEYQVIL